MTKTNKWTKLGNLTMIVVDAGAIFHLAIITNSTLGKTGKAFAFGLAVDLSIRAYTIVWPYIKGDE